MEECREQSGICESMASRGTGLFFFGAEARVPSPGCTPSCVSPATQFGLRLREGIAMPLVHGLLLVHTRTPHARATRPCATHVTPACVIRVDDLVR
jgi:hypothetical protein